MRSPGAASRAGWGGAVLLLGTRLEERFATYDAVTPEDIQAAARRFLVPTRRTVGILRGGRS